MILRISLLQKLDGLSVDAFDTHWRDVHAPLAIKLEGLALYHLNMVRGDIGGALLPLWPSHGVAQLGFKDLQAMKQAGSTPAGKADRANFIKEQHTMVCERQSVTGSTGPGIGASKCMVFVTRRAELGEAAFRQAWTQEQGEGMRRLPGVVGMARNIVVDRWLQPWVSAPYDTMPVDAVEELWFDSERALDAALASPALTAVQADRAGYIARSIHLKLGECHVVG